MWLVRFRPRSLDVGSVLVLLTAMLGGCSCSGDETVPFGPTATTGTGGAGGVTTTTDEGGGGAGASGGHGGSGGSGGTLPVGSGVSESVSAGSLVRSPSYSMVFTFGQPTQNQEKTASPSYSMQGGLQGANGSLP